MTLAALLLPLMVAGSPAFADQNDKRLGSLFTLLRSASSYPVAYPVEQQIWSIWSVSPQEKANVAMRLGFDAMNRRDFDSAVVFFGNAAKADEDFAEAFNKRATAFFLMGRFQDSLTDIQKTLDLEPRHFGALSGLGQIYLRLEQPEAALKAVELALEIHPTQPGMQATRDSLKQVLEDQKT